MAIIHCPCGRSVEGSLAMVPAIEELRKQLGFNPKRGDLLRAAACKECAVGRRFRFDPELKDDSVTCFGGHCEAVKLGMGEGEKAGFIPPNARVGSDGKEVRLSRGQLKASLRCYKCSIQGIFPLDRALEKLERDDRKVLAETKQRQRDAKRGREGRDGGFVKPLGSPKKENVKVKDRPRRKSEGTGASMDDIIESLRRFDAKQLVVK